MSSLPMNRSAGVLTGFGVIRVSAVNSWDSRGLRAILVAEVGHVSLINQSDNAARSSPCTNPQGLVRGR